jgi:hypothetical protein
MRGYWIDGPLGCHVWDGALNSDGYPVVRHHGKVMLARRVLWEEHNGPIPEGHVLRNECMKRSCVRPDHQVLLPDAVARALPRRRRRSVAPSRA